MTAPILKIAQNFQLLIYTKMGQYYKACLINDNGIKIIRPSGWKMMEHCWYGNIGMERVEKLLNEEHYRVIWL